MALELQYHCSSPSILRKSSLSASYRRIPTCTSCFKASYLTNFVKSGKIKYKKRLLLSISERPLFLQRSNWCRPFILPATSDDGIVVNGSSKASSSEEDDVEKMRQQLDESLEGKGVEDDLVQFLHDTARSFELSLEKKGLKEGPLFAKGWLGIDKNAWVKTVSYQASVHALLQASLEVTARDGRNKEINNVVRRSMLRLCNPLEKSINDEILSKDAITYDWFWTQQHPIAVSNYISFLEDYIHFTDVVSIKLEIDSLSQNKANALPVLLLAMSTISATMKLGTGKISCFQFASDLYAVYCKIMDAMAGLVPIDKVYHFTTELDLQSEYLDYLGRRILMYRTSNEIGEKEKAFWVDLIQQQLRRAIDRERIWARLTTYESIEVLERDLAIFGFFVALGRRTQSYLEAAGYSQLDESLSRFLRYLVGGCTLYYPQLSSLSTYQLFVEVACEEMEWLQFYPEEPKPGQADENVSKDRVETDIKDLMLALNTCSHWLQDFTKYSAWLENPSNIKATKFLSTSSAKLDECRFALSILGENASQKDEMVLGDIDATTMSSSTKTFIGIEEINLYEKELQGVDKALNRLEGLLKEIHVCSSISDKEHLEAACSNLERIRKLKKEAEFLEASLKAKAASLQQDAEDEYIQSFVAKNKSKDEKFKQANKISRKRKTQKSAGYVQHGLRDFLLSHSSAKKGMEDDRAQNVDFTEDKDSEQSEPEAAVVSNEIRRFEQLQNELMELERRFQESAEFIDKKAQYSQKDSSEDSISLQETRTKSNLLGKEVNIVGKSIGKMREVGLDVFQGTQLLATDVGAALVLIRRALTGDELTDKEKKALLRTLTDVASVIPIGILMLLPVTAVGHAAMLAGIKRYMPGLIPSAYARERLELLRQLQKIKEMETSPSDLDGAIEDVSVAGLNAANEKS